MSSSGLVCFSAFLLSAIVDDRTIWIMSGTIRVPVELLSGIAEWPTPNYVDPVRRTWLPAFMLVWLLAATMLLGGRFYLRARKLAGGFGFDDLLIGLGWVSCVLHAP